ncbi:MAG: LacI family DNA-binding transcriptional regulator [Flavobacteriaceae bacterium]
MFSGVTLKEISSLSGYSISTVSKALNDRDDIKESTKSKIQKIAKHNNYVPNSSARALRNRRTKVIAVIIPKITDTYFNIFVCEIQKKAFAIGYRILVLQSFNNLKKEKACINFVNDGSVDGILMLSNTEFENIGFKTISPKNFKVIPYPEVNSCHNIESIKETAISKFQELLSI